MSNIEQEDEVSFLQPSPLKYVDSFATPDTQIIGPMHEVQSGQESELIEPSNTELAELPECSRRYIEGLQSNLDTAHQQIEELKSMLESADQSITGWKEELDVAQLRIKKLETEIKRLKEDARIDKVDFAAYEENEQVIIAELEKQVEELKQQAPDQASGG